MNTDFTFAARQSLLQLPGSRVELTPEIYFISAFNHSFRERRRRRFLTILAEVQSVAKEYLQVKIGLRHRYEERTFQTHFSPALENTFAGSFLARWSVPHHTDSIFHDNAGAIDGPVTDAMFKLHKPSILRASYNVVIPVVLA
jgi:hypothetical protein